MPLLKVPHLSRNRHGVFVFRLRSGTLDQRVSLGTKDPLAAHVMAAKINEAVEASRISDACSRMGWRNPKLEGLGVDFSAIRKDAFGLSRRASIAIVVGGDAQFLEALALVGSRGLALSTIQRVALAPPPSLKPVSMAISKVAEMWLAERAHKNGPRTVYMKKCQYADFEKRIGKGIEIDSVTKAVMVGYKSACLAAGQKAKTIDNKLMSISDLFKYAIAHGLYTASPTSPVSSLFMQTNSERLAKAESYKPFTDDDLKKMFESEGLQGRHGGAGPPLAPAHRSI